MDITFPPFTFEGLVRNPELTANDVERKAFVEFIASMLKLAPEERLDAEELLKAEWLKDCPSS